MISKSHYYSYLRGEWRKEGWWYYYLYGLAMKVPLGVWALALAGGGAAGCAGGATRRRGGTS